MKRNLSVLTAALVLVGATVAVSVNAQDNERPDRPGRGGDRPAPPLAAALDTNSDGKLDAGEIANASASLATLDKNGDGEITRDEVRPERDGKGPEGGRGPKGGGKHKKGENGGDEAAPSDQ